MSYAVMAYRVDLELVARQIGLPKEQRMPIRRRLMGTFTARRMSDPTAISIAVSNLLIGPPYGAEKNTHEAAYLGYAFEALCDAFGTSLNNNPLSGCRFEFIENVNQHMKALGFEVMSDLTFRGAPLALPSIADFPGIGYLRADEVLDLDGRMQGVDLRAESEPLSKLDSWARNDVLEASEMLRAWVQEARAHAQGIAAFYY